MFRRILLAIDGSPESFRAARAGVDLARVHGATAIGVFITAPLHVAEVFPGNLSLGVHVSQEYQICANLEAEAFLDEVANYARTAEVAWHSVVACAASAAPALVAACADQRADLIVLAPRGRGAGDGLPLGSTATKVLSLSPVPVLLMRNAAAEPAPGAPT